MFGSWDEIGIVGALVAIFGGVRGGPLLTPEIEPAIKPGLVVGEECPLQWPDDPDLVPSWRLEAERRASSIGLTLPSYRTHRDYANQVASIRAALAAEEAADVPAPEPVPDPVPALALPVVTELLPALPAKNAAKQFLAAARAAGGGQFTNEELTESYLKFCRDAGRMPAPENFVRQFLRGMRGVTAEMMDTRDAAGKRTRWTRWTIHPEQTATRNAA